MLQYMSCAIPVVVSPVGMNAQVLSQGAVGFAASSTSDWVDAITSLVRDWEQRRSMGAMGREVVQARDSVHAIAPRLEAAIRSVT
jgi:glycosyltransferase involved in cell wall biosynthesis